MRPKPLRCSIHERIVQAESGKDIDIICIEFIVALTYFYLGIFNAFANESFAEALRFTVDHGSAINPDWRPFILR